MQLLQRQPERGYGNAQQASNQYYGQAQQAQQPYLQTGQQGSNNLQDMYGQLSNPQQLQNQWTQSYQMSPYAKQLQSNATDAGLNSAGAMGLLGSSAAQNNIQQQSSEIANADYQQYMKDLMEKFLAAKDIGTTQLTTGANVANQYSQNAMHQGEDQAQLEYEKYNAGPALFAKLFGQATGGALGGR